MHFNVKKWRRIYDKVQFLGQIIKDANESVDEEGKWVPALYPISRDTKKSIETEIKGLMIECNICLDSGGIRPKPPLWKYNNEDPTTWPSYESFRFNHLLKPGVKRCTIGYHP